LANPEDTAKMLPAPTLLGGRCGCDEVVDSEGEPESEVPHDFALVGDRRQWVEDGVFVLAVVIAG
jgi:hypothetical protein